MKNKAFVNGQEYTLVEILPSLDGGPMLVLCKNSSGKKAICSESLWQANAPKDECAAPIHTNSPTQEKINFFPLDI